MGPPFATGMGIVGLLILLSFFLFSATPLVIVPAVLLILLAVAGMVTAGRAADREGTAPDPVTGGRRWWQKRWDE